MRGEYCVCTVRGEDFNIGFGFFVVVVLHGCVCLCVCLQHLFALEAHGDLVKCIMEAAAAYVGIAIRQRKEPITYEQFLTNRMGKYRSGWLLLELD